MKQPRSSEKYTDHEIVEQIEKGNDEPLVQLYHDNIAMVRKYVRDNNGKEEDAEDLLQEALVVLWENVTTGRFKLNAKISTYLYSVVRNKWLREIGKRKIGKTTGLDFRLAEEHFDVLADVIRDEKLELIMACLDKLSPICQKVLVKFYLEEKNLNEIAGEVGFSNSDVVKSKKYQCKKELQALIEKAL